MNHKQSREARVTDLRPGCAAQHQQLQYSSERRWSKQQRPYRQAESINKERMSEHRLRRPTTIPAYYCAGYTSVGVVERVWMKVGALALGVPWDSFAQTK
jgi:hypothetical protein